MDFRFGAGDRGPPGYTSSVPGPLPPPLEWQAPPRELVIREQVTRRLTEEWAKDDPAFARGLSEGLFAPDRFMPPPPHAPVPMPMHPLPHAPPPVPFEGFGAWQGFGRPLHAGFGERTRFLFGAKWGSTPRPDPKHKLKLLEVEPSGRPEALSPKVPMMKSKADANAATIVPKKVQILAEDWSCAPPYQVSAPSEAGLNEHLGGREHKAKLAQCGVSKAIKDDKNCLQTTTGNENNTDPCDAPKKICMLVDGEMHEVARKNDYLWCDRCRVRCHSKVIMAGHLRSKKHSKLNKVWTSIKAVRTNTDTKEGLPSCGSQVNTNSPTEIPAVIEGDINMTTGVDESGSIENAVQKEIHLRSKKHSKLNDGWTSIKAVRTNTDTKKQIHPWSKKQGKLNNVWTSIKAARTNTDTKEGLPSCGSQVPSMKRKADANAATIVPKKVQKLAEDWSCALCQLSAPSEAGLNVHLAGRKHKAKLAQCGVSKVIKDDKNCSQTTTGNENSTDPCDAPKQICLLVDGEMHVVVRKNNYLWCYCCGVRCNESATMACHLRSKKHSKLTKVWTSINAVRTNNDTKEVLPSCGSQALSSNPKVPTVKRKADANAATTVPKKVQKPTKDWSCALCQVSRPCEAALNAHLGGTKHKAKLPQCGVSKTIKDGKNCSQMTTGNENSTDPCDAPKKICMLGGRKHKATLAQCGVSKTIKDGKNCSQTTTGNENSTDPRDAPMKICMLVDGAMHEVVRKDNYLWCDHCRVSCDNYATMACHLRCKKQSKLAKVCSSIKAVTTNTNTKEGLPSSFGSQVNTKGSTEIPAVIEGDINMTTEVDKSGSVENPVQKEIQRMATIWAMFSC